jgi:hypothetical protein
VVFGERERGTSFFASIIIQLLVQLHAQAIMLRRA